MFTSTILCKIFWENIKSQNKLDRIEKTFVSVFAYFWAPVPKICFCWRNWALYCVFMQFWEIYWYFLFSQDSSLKSLGNSWGNSHVTFLTLDIKFRFTFGEWKLYYIFVQFPNIMNRIAHQVRNYSMWQHKFHELEQIMQYALYIIKANLNMEGTFLD